jgi:hypothetical protein
VRRWKEEWILKHFFFSQKKKKSCEMLNCFWQSTNVKFQWKLSEKHIFLLSTSNPFLSKWNWYAINNFDEERSFWFFLVLAMIDSQNNFSNRFLGKSRERQETNVTQTSGQTHFTLYLYNNNNHTYSPFVRLAMWPWRIHCTSLVFVILKHLYERRWLKTNI